MRRRAGVIGVGLIAAATLAWPAAIATAAQPAAKVKVGSQWTLVEVGSGCEVLNFKTADKFTADRLGDKGTYTSVDKTLTLLWKKGNNAGATFSGTYVKQTIDGPEYQGSFGGALMGHSGGLIEGAASGC
jgi:hypothetical protein